MGDLRRHGRVLHASLVDYLRVIGQVWNLFRLLLARVAVGLVEGHVARLLGLGFEFDPGRRVGRRRHFFQARLLLFHESNFLLSIRPVSM